MKVLYGVGNLAGVKFLVLRARPKRGHAMTSVGFIIIRSLVPDYHSPLLTQDLAEMTAPVMDAGAKS